MGPFAGFAENREHMLRVLDMHRQEAADIDEELVPAELLGAAQETLGRRLRARRASTACATRRPRCWRRPARSGLLMDCDTTGIEPDLGLVKMKKLVGGGTMSIVNQTVPRALRRLGYDDDQIDEIVAYIDEHKSILGAPHLTAEHLAVFACSMGDNAIHYSGHVRMMGAVQPFISGAISKTVNMPEDVTVEDVEQLHIDAWRLGLKAVAIYRDNCKVAQPLSTGKGEGAAVERDRERDRGRRARRREGDHRQGAGAREAAAQPHVAHVRVPGRRLQGLRHRRRVRTTAVRARSSSASRSMGSTLAGIMDAFAISVSYGLQYGVPLRAYVETLANYRFEPAGMTDDPDIRFASSLVDYIFRRLAIDYLSAEERAELNILSVGERTQPTLPGVEETVDRDRAGPRHPLRSAVDRVGPHVARPGRASAPVPCPRGTGGRSDRRHTCRTPTRRTACSAASRCSGPARATPARVAGAPAAVADATWVDAESIRRCREHWCDVDRGGRARQGCGSPRRRNGGSKPSAASASPRKACCIVVVGAAGAAGCRRAATTRRTSVAPSRRSPTSAFGRLLLLILTVGLALHCCWRLVLAARGGPGEDDAKDDREADRRPRSRADLRLVHRDRGQDPDRCAATAAAVAAVEQQRKAVGTVLDWPGGKAIVVAGRARRDRRGAVARQQGCSPASSSTISISSGRSETTRKVITVARLDRFPRPRHRVLHDRLVPGRVGARRRPEPHGRPRPGAPAAGRLRPRPEPAAARRGRPDPVRRLSRHRRPPARREARSRTPDYLQVAMPPSTGMTAPVT